VFSSIPGGPYDIDLDVYRALSTFDIQIGIQELIVPPSLTSRRKYHIFATAQLSILSIHLTPVSFKFVQHVGDNAPNLSHLRLSGLVTPSIIKVVLKLRNLRELEIQFTSSSHPHAASDQRRAFCHLATSLDRLPSLSRLCINIPTTIKRLPSALYHLGTIDILMLYGDPELVAQLLMLANNLRHATIELPEGTTDSAWRRCFRALLSSSGTSLLSIKLLLSGLFDPEASIGPLLRITALQSFEISDSTISFLPLSDSLIENMVFSWPTLQTLIFPSRIAGVFRNRLTPQCLLSLDKLGCLRTMCIPINRDTIRLPLAIEHINDHNVRRVLETCRWPKNVCKSADSLLVCIPHFCADVGI